MSNTRQIIQIGNSLGITIPDELLTAVNLIKGSTAYVEFYYDRFHRPIIAIRKPSTRS